MKLVFKKIFISSDHAGFNIKNFIINTLKKKKIPIKDLGPYNDSSVDYPDYAKLVSRQIRSKKTAGGILVCGSGTGMAISANKIRGIRAAMCYNNKSTYLCRQHNNANVLCLGARMTTRKNIKKIVSVFLETKFEGGRHQKRIKKI